MTFRSLRENKKLASSANIIGSSGAEPDGSQFTYICSKSGPKIDLCGTPDIIARL